MKRALLIVDLQRDFCTGGALGIQGSESIVPTINRLAQRYDTVLASKDWHPPQTIHFQSWPVHCVRDSPGAEFHPDFDASRVTQLFLKGTHNCDDGYSAFEAGNLNLSHYLQAEAITAIDLCGLATDYCVRATAYEALQLGFGVRVIVDAVAAVDRQAGDGKLALAEMQAAGVELIYSGQILTQPA